MQAFANAENGTIDLIPDTVEEASLLETFSKRPVETAPGDIDGNKSLQIYC
jgi:hypothetical protein